MAMDEQMDGQIYGIDDEWHNEWGKAQTPKTITMSHKVIE
jgi:hypothetical protein